MKNVAWCVISSPPLPPSGGGGGEEEGPGLGQEGQGQGQEGPGLDGGVTRPRKPEQEWS